MTSTTPSCCKYTCLMYVYLHKKSVSVTLWSINTNLEVLVIGKWICFILLSEKLLCKLLLMLSYVLKQRGVNLLLLVSVYHNFRWISSQINEKITCKFHFFCFIIYGPKTQSLTIMFCISLCILYLCSMDIFFKFYWGFTRYQIWCQLFFFFF